MILLPLWSFIGTIAKIAVLINFADIFTSNATHERIQKPTFRS